MLNDKHSNRIYKLIHTFPFEIQVLYFMYSYNAGTAHPELLAVLKSRKQALWGKVKNFFFIRITNYILLYNTIFKEKIKSVS